MTDPVAWFDSEGKIRGRVSDEQLDALCRDAIVQIARRNGWDLPFELVRDADSKVVGVKQQPEHRALTQVLDGLLASLGREPTEAELRAAAHSLTVRADRIAMARPAYRGARWEDL